MKPDVNNTGKERQLRKHKSMATGLFLLMLVVYSLMTWWSSPDPGHWTGYVRAFSEAAMVGALADWFAVTALFHHPLGIPIPHTNLIEKSKKTIGDNLGSFVVSNFLTPQNIRPYIRKIGVSAYVADWLEKDRNKDVLITEVTWLLKDIVQKMDDSAVSGFIARKGKELIDQVPLHKVAASALQYFLDRGEQEQLITFLAGKIKVYISGNETMVQEKVKKESYFFIPKFIDNKLASKITHALIRYFQEIESDPSHKIRQEIAGQLYQLADEIRSQPKWEAEFNKLKSGLLSDENISKYASDIWMSLKLTLTEELSAPDSGLKRYFRKTIRELSGSLRNDEALRQKIDGWIRLNGYRYILRNTEHVGLLISNTVGNWQGRELSRKLELEVGKDLQFIRINGTIVGGLVGLLIHTLTRLLT
jgi:uncharacterized membrane-anchored protein YjiN (DUF445 family)